MDKPNHSDNGKHNHKHGDNHANMATDVADARTAWDLWNSKNPKDWDKAMDIVDKNNEHKHKYNKKEWNGAMDGVAAEAEAKKIRHQPKIVHRQGKIVDPESGVIQIQDINALDNKNGKGALNNVALTDADNRIKHPGYAPDSRFAPETPDSPAYDAVYNQPKPEFHGLDLGIVKLGYNDSGSLEAGVNIGIAKTDVQLGANTRVDAEFMPIGGPIHARTGAGVKFSENGVQGDVGAGGNFFNIVNGDADFDARVGKNTGVDGDVRGKVYPVNVQAEAGADVGPNGVHAYTGANTDVADVAGIRTGGYFNLDDKNSGMGAGLGLKAGDRTVDLVPRIGSDGNQTFIPDLQLDQGSIDDEPLYPTGNRNTKK